MPMVLRAILAGMVALLLLSSAPLAGATATVTALARLGGTPDGYDPQGTLVDGGDGFFYGTTEAGGPANGGTVYRIAADGTFATLYAFTGGTDGANPQAALLNAGDGFFYGTTSSGGNGSGTVFRVTPPGSIRCSTTSPRARTEPRRSPHWCFRAESFTG